MRKKTFEERIDKTPSTGCWHWTGMHRNGYGRFKVGEGRYEAGRTKYLGAHRVAWEMANGRPVPEGMVVMHSCDNPGCVNPAHLSVGTQHENILDSVRKGGHKFPVFRGSESTSSKITDADVITIRARVHKRGDAVVYAKQLGISVGQYHRILKGERWPVVRSA